VADRVAARLDPTLLSAVATEDAAARLDERLDKSPLREGVLARGHFADACFALASSSISTTSSSMMPRWICARPPMSAPTRRRPGAPRPPAAWKPCNGAFSD